MDPVASDDLPSISGLSARSSPYLAWKSVQCFAETVAFILELILL